LVRSLNGQMKVLFFYQYFTTPQGSWSTRAYEFARRWVAAGDEVTVVTSVYDKSDLRPRGAVERFEIDGIDVRVINVRLSNKHGNLKRIVTFLWYALVSSWFALTIPADVVLASSGPITVGIPGLMARYLRRSSFVFEVRDLWPEGAIQLGVLRSRFMIRIARAFERLCYRSSKVVVAASPGQAAWVAKRCRRCEVVVVPNASDNDLFGEADPLVDFPEELRGNTLVTYTGTLGLIDNCVQIVEAAKVLSSRGEDDVAVVMIGDGKESVDLEESARRLGLGNIHFLGLMPKTEVARWVAASSCMLISFLPVSVLDTVSPNKLFDAFAAGVPVVQTTQGWIKELLDREECGFTVPAGNAEAMADAILRLTRDTALRERMGRNAKRVAEEQFDRDMLAKEMRDVLHEAAGI
jgi:glycosyltransferase involved in cell wall biosynthesis